MSSRNSSQRNMSHLTKITNFSAPFYDLIFKSFWWGHENNYRRQVIELMDLNGNESVLDVGCGTGTLTSMIADRMNGKGNVFGIDLSPRMIKIAKKETCRQGNYIEYRIGSSLALPFDNETFEVVVTSLMYHQLMSREERVRTVGEIRRVLKPEGRYIAAEFIRFTPGNLLITHDSLIRRIPLFSPDLLEEGGFHITEKVEIARGVKIILAKKVTRQDVLSKGVIA